MRRLCYLAGAMIATSCTSLPPDLERARYQDVGGTNTVSFAEGRIFVGLGPPFLMPGWRQTQGYDFLVEGNELLLALTSVEASGAIGSWEFRFNATRDRLMVRDKRSGTMRELTRDSTARLTFPNTKH